MTTTEHMSVETVLRDARRLPKPEQAQLIGRLAQELAAPEASADAPVRDAPADATALLAALAAIDVRGGDGWEKFQAIAADIHAHYPDADVSGALAAQRRERHAMLIGTANGDADVHA